MSRPYPPEKPKINESEYDLSTPQETPKVEKVDLNEYDLSSIVQPQKPAQKQRVQQQQKIRQLPKVESVSVTAIPEEGSLIETSEGYTPEQQEKIQKEKARQENEKFLAEAKRVRQLRTQPKLTPQDKDAVTRYDTFRNQQRTELSKRTEEYTKTYNKEPEEGLVGSDEEVKRLKDVGLNQKAAAPQQDDKGNFSIAGQGLIDLSQLRQLKGQELRNAGAKKYASFVGFSPEEQDAIVATANLRDGGKGLWQTFSDQKPVEEVDDLIDRGEYMPSGDKDFVTYTDSNATITKLGLLARLAKAQTGEMNPETIKDYWNKMESYTFKEEKDTGFDEDSLKKAEDEQSFTGQVSNAFGWLFRQMMFNDDTIEVERMRNAIVGGSVETTTGGAKSDREKSVEDIAAQLVALKNYHVTTRAAEVFRKIAEKPDGRLLFYASPVLYGAVKQIVPDIDKYIPTPTKLGETGAMLAPVALGNAGLPVFLSQMSNSLQNASPDTYNKLMAVGIITMGAGHAAGALKGTIGSLNAAAAQGAAAATQVGSNYAVNWKAYQDSDGSVNWSNLIRDLTVDAAMVGLSPVEIVKAVKDKSNPEVYQTINMVVKNSETGDFAMFVKNPDSGVLEMRPIEGAKVEVWQKAQQEQGRQYILQEVPKETFDSIMVNNSSTGIKRLWEVVTGQPNRAVEREKDLLANTKTVRKEKIVDGEVQETTKAWNPKAIFDEKGDLQGVKTDQRLAQRVSEADREFAALKLLKEYKAPLNINSNLMQGGEDTVALVKKMSDRGVIRIDDKGQVSITDAGNLLYEQGMANIETFKADVDSMRSKYGSGDHVDSKMMSEDFKENPFITKGDSEYDYSSGDIHLFSERKRQAIAAEVAQGRAEFDESTGTIRSKFRKPVEEKSSQKPAVQESVNKPVNEQAPQETPFERVKQKKIQKEELSNLSFRKLDPEEKLPKSKTITVREKDSDRMITFHRDEYGTYRPTGAEAGISHGSLSDKLRSGEFELAVTKTSKIAGREGQETGGYYWSERPFEKEYKHPSEPYTGKEPTFGSKEEDIFNRLHGKVNPEEEFESLAKTYNMSIDDVARTYVRQYEKFLKSGDEQPTLFSRAASTIDDFRAMIRRRVNNEDNTGLDDFKLPANTIAEEFLNYVNKEGTLTLDKNTKVDIGDKKWDVQADPDFVESKADSSRVYVNHAMSQIIQRGLHGIVNKYTPDGETMSVNEAKSLGAVLSGAAERLPDGTIKDGVARIAEFFARQEGNADYIVVRPDHTGYDKFRGTSLHEKIHKELARYPELNIFKNDETIAKVFETPEGEEFDKLLRNSRYAHVTDNPQFKAHELLAMGTNKESLHMLGVFTSSDAETYAKMYVKVLKAVVDEHGADLGKMVDAYQDPRVKELVRKVKENEERIESDRLSSTSGGRGVLTEARRGSIAEEGGRTAQVKAEEWRGSGIKSSRYRRLTPDGNPLSLTGIGGADKAQRLRENAKPTFNFYVEKPDGTFSYETELQSPRLLPYDIDADFNLIDMSTDAEAWQKYVNTSFPEFQKWAEEKGYHGFFSSSDMIADTFRYRMSLFNNDTVKAMLKPATLASKTQDEAFYSAIERAVTTGRLPEKAPAKDYLNILRNTQGVKKDELDWTGITDVLEKWGDKIWTKDQLLNLVRTQKVVVKDIIYATDGTKSDKAPMWADYGGLVTEGERRDDVEIVLQVPNLQKGQTKGIYGSRSKSDYQTTFDRRGGGDNITVSRENWYGDTVEDTYPASDFSPDQAIQAAWDKDHETTSFQSGHWEDTNVILHVRGNGRTAVDGKNIFLIDEIQSDLHQEGREMGYVSEETKQQITDLEKQIYALDAEGKKNGRWIRSQQFLENPASAEEIARAETKATELHNKVTELSKEYNKLKQLIPDAPFKETWHELGFKKALRYAVENGYDRVAWTTGKQQIDRNENALRKNVDRIEYKPIPVRTQEQRNELVYKAKLKVEKFDKELEEAKLKAKENLVKELEPKGLTLTAIGEHGVFNYMNNDHNVQLAKQRLEQAVNFYDDVLVSRSNEGKIAVEAFKNGNKVVTQYLPLEGSTRVGNRDVSLDNLLGGKLAAEVREKGGEGFFEGEDLSIGGAMHKMLYDQKLPSFVKKYVKKWGAEVGETQIKTKRGFIQKRGNGEIILVNEDGDLHKIFKSIDEAKKYDQTYGAENFHSVDITQEMRQSVMEGQTLFAKSEASATSFKQQVAAMSRRDPDSVLEDRKMRKRYDTKPEDHTPKTIKDIIERGNWSAITTVKDGDASKLDALKKDLDMMGYRYVEAEGVFAGEKEKSLIVYYPREESNRIVQVLGNKYNQDAVLHGVGGKYNMEFSDGQRMESESIHYMNGKNSDRTEMKLKGGKLDFNIDFDWEHPTPAPQDYSLKAAEAKIAARERWSDKTVLTPEDIRRVYTGEIELTDGNDKVINPKAVYDQAGQKVGAIEVDDNGAEFVNVGKVRVEMVDGIGRDSKGNVYYQSKAKRDILGAIGMWQTLVQDLNGTETLKRPYTKDKAEVEAYNAQRAEVWMAHVKPILNQWHQSDGHDFGASWYHEAETFATKVGRDIKDVNNDVVKLWLHLTTALTSPNTSVIANTGFALKAMSSLVRFYETGKLFIPKFQYDESGNLIFKEDGTPKKLGLGSQAMEKLEMLSKGFIPVESVEGFELFGKGAKVLKPKEVLGDAINNNVRYVFSPTARAMMEKHGALQGILNFLLSPALENKKFNKAVDIFGDKLGAFMSNLMGLTQIPTIDTWMNRYFRGLTGDALEVTRNREGRITKIKDNSMNFDERDGDMFRGVIQKATEEFNKENGTKLTPADTQAIIWTQVKDLFNSIVKAEQDNVDFSQAYDQIKARLGGMPSAESNPELLKDAAKKAPVVKDMTTGSLKENYGQDYFIESSDGVSLAMKADDPVRAKSKKIDTSDELLAKGDFDAWIDVASRLVKGGFLSDGEIKKIKELSGDPKKVEELHKYILGLNKMGVLELLTGLLRVNPLVGVKNIARNTTSNTLNQFASELSRIPAFMIDVALNEVNRKAGGLNYERTVLAPSVISTGKALYKSLTSGLPKAVKFFAKGGTANFEHPSLFRDRTTGWAVLKPLELYMKYGFRLQESADIPFKTFAYYRSLDELVKIKAKKLGVSPKEAMTHMTSEDFDQAFDTAVYLTFQDSNIISDKYYKFRDGQSPLVRAIMDLQIPYIKTPLNVVKTVLDYSGIFPLLKGVNKELSSTEWIGLRDNVAKILDTPEDRQAIAYGIGRGMVGWTTAYIGFKLGMAGVMMSFFDKDERKETDQMAAKGVSYGTIQIGDYSVDISSLLPVSFYMLSGAAYAQAQKEYQERYAKDPNTDYSVNGAAISTILKNLALQTPILGTAIRMYDDNSRTENGRLPDLSRLLGVDRAVPAVVGEVAQTLDKKERVIDNKTTLTKAKETIQSKIPLWREQLPVRVDMLGREIEAPNGFDPLKTKKVKKDLLTNELDRFDLNVTDTTKGSTKERNESHKAKGEYFTPALESVVKSPQYTEASDKYKKEMLQDVMRYVNDEYKNDKRPEGDEKHNINVIIERNSFLDKLSNNPSQFDKDVSYSDKKLVQAAKKIGVSEIKLNDLLDFMVSKNIEKFVQKQFLYNYSVNDDMKLAEAQKNLAEFKADPLGQMVKWYIYQKEYDERTARLAKRKSELTEQGKTEKEIESILHKESAQLGWKHRRMKQNEVKVVKDKTRDNFLNLRQSENIEDKR